MRTTLLAAGLIALVASGPAAAADAANQASALAREGDELYRKGAYSEALRKLEAAMAAGLETPEVLYQAGNCYRVAMSDAARELELKRKAVPLLEEEISSGRGGIDSHYYLAAIYIHNLQDPVKGVDVSRKGVALVEKGGPGLRSPVENIYRAARLYEFLGEDDKSAGMDGEFLKAADSSTAVVDKASLRISREKLASYDMRKEKYAEAAALYEALVKADPLRDAERHQWGLALLRAGDTDGALKAWRQAKTDEFRTEFAYLEKVVSRYVASGRPASSQTVPEAASLPDQELGAKVVEAGKILQEKRLKAEAEAKEKKDAVMAAENAKKEEILALSPEERKARWEAKKKELLEGVGDDPAAQARRLEQAAKSAQRALIAKAPGIPVKDEQWQAAEKEFFYLLTEYVRRGHLIRLFCFQNGISDAVFR